MWELNLSLNSCSLYGRQYPHVHAHTMEWLQILESQIAIIVGILGTHIYIHNIYTLQVSTRDQITQVQNQYL